MNINQLKDAFDMTGQKVQDLKDGHAQFAIDLGRDENSHSVDDIKKSNASLKSAKMAQELAKSAYEDTRINSDAEPVSKEPLPVKGGKPDVQTMKNQFIKDFEGLVTSGTTGIGNAGLTIPKDIQLQTGTLARSFASLESLMNAENVTTSHDSRVCERLADITPLRDLDDESALIGDNDDSESTVARYLIRRYTGVTTVTNTLLEDTVDNIIQWLVNWAAKKDAVTRNVKILGVMSKAPRKLTISKFDDIKDLEDNTLSPAIESTSSSITNQSGYNILSKLKDANGRYLMQPDVTSLDKYVTDSKPVIHMADKWLPDASGSHPLHFGDLKQDIILFDRQQMQIDITNVGIGSFERGTTKLRFIDRFDAQLIDDDAFAAALFKAVASQAKSTADISR